MFFVVKSYMKRALLLAAGLLSAIIMPGQNLPVLSPDSSVKTGILPNGMSYYIISNPTIAGKADFALVQKVGTDNIPDSSAHRAVQISRDALAAFSRDENVSVQGFYASHGVTPGKEGYVKVSDNATVFRFEDVLLSRPEVLDSALLVLLDIADRARMSEDAFIKKWYSPSDQAVVIAGDVAPGAVADKLKMISYMTPPSMSSPRKEYIWEEKDSAEFIRMNDAHEGLSTLTAVWSSARTPREYMNTVQPAIYEMFLAELGMIAENYIRQSLNEEGIPYAQVTSGRRTSVQSSGDEAFSISVTVAEKDFPDAARITAEVMGRIDAGKTHLHDVVRMKRICMDQAKEQAFSPVVSNSDHVDKCVTAFIYNGSLASLKSKVDFLAGRAIADTVELRLFNSISSALLDKERNLRLSYSHEMPEDSVRAVFSNAWDSFADKADSSSCAVRKGLDFPPLSGQKMKIRSEKTDHMSKGTEWTFSNGFKVVYRRMPTGGRFHYTLALNGGFGSIEDIEKGEGGYISDYFMLGRISGMPADDFIASLAEEGMSMDAYTGLNATMISGSADDDRFDFMLRALIAAINSWHIDDEAVRRYESCEPLRNVLRMGTKTEMVAKVNEIMCPDYKHVSYKMLDSLPHALAAKADKFFRELFMKTNDGVLILLGDVDPAVLKKTLPAYVDGFKTTDRAFRRPLVRYQPSSGWSTYTVDGDRNSVDIALSVPMALTADNYMTAEIAAMVLRKNLSDAVADTGMYPSLSHECRIYPNERVNFHISLNEVSGNGFSSGTEQAGPIEALAIVRSVLSGVGEVEVRSEDVEAFKKQLLAGLEVEMKKPFYWLNVISRRHLAGKDFTTSHEARIKSVTADKVKGFLSKLNEGTRVEYIVSKK